jgi:RHS repeat-associated protein
VAAREESQTQYENLGSAEAAKSDREALPALLGEPDGGAPRLPVGARITGYSSNTAAQVEFGGGKRGVVESAVPVATEVGGVRRPLDLSLTDTGGSFEPTLASVGVRAPRRVGDGVVLGETGVSLAPVDSQGAALPASEGVLDGAGVLYANGLDDTDVLVKPSAVGFSEDDLLRSVRSPQQLFFRVGMPQGATLIQGRSGAVRVVSGATLLAIVLPPHAQDAAGTPVPVSMDVSGSTLAVSVSAQPGAYRYPIAVDPTVISYTKWYPWQFATNNEKGFCGTYQEEVNNEPSADYVSLCGAHERGQYGAFLYTTQGESRIEKFRANTWSWIAEAASSSYMSILHSHYEAEPLLLPAAYGSHEVSASKEPTNGNTAAFEVIATTTTSGWVEGSANFMNPEVTIEQEAGPQVLANTTEEVVNGEQNALYGNRWASATTGKWGIETNASDPGLGIQSTTATSPNAANWRGFTEGVCSGVQCQTPVKPGVPLKGATEQLPEGEGSVEVKVKDPVGLSATTGLVKIKVDDAAPHGLTLSGLGSGNQIGEREYNLKAEATDGTGTTPSSGIRSLAVSIDGHEVGKPVGSCTPGPCTATGEWTISGAEYGAGEHKIKLTATDNAGNLATEEVVLKVHHAAPVAVGPGTVGPQSGALTLSVADASVSTPGAALTLTRTANSRTPAAGSTSPLGPQWSMSLGGEESILKFGSSATLTAVSGGKTTFTSNGKGGFTAPAGDANLSLSEVKNEAGELTELALKNASNHATTRFTSSGPLQGYVWNVSRQEGALPSQTVRYTYQTVEGVSVPVEALAPEPAGVTCGKESKELKAGCRALTFEYAKGTSAGGENASEWGEYKGRLKEVLYTAYNPSSKAMATTAVAQYAYDKQGRLRAEWNPQITPALKTIYGYDPEGHVTALTPPGQESWVFSYGTSAGDLNPGRLLKITRAPVATALWGGEGVKNTAPPQITGSPVPGVRLAVSNGTWSNNPVGYAYQWENCNPEGKECTLIAGANNANYTPTESDVGHTLIAQVIATSGGGSVIASSTATHRVGAVEEYALPKSSGPYGIAAGSDGNLWFTELGTGKIGKITTSGTVTEYSGAVFPTKIAPGPDNNLWFTTWLLNKIGKITTAGVITQYTLPEKSYPWGITAGPDGNLWATENESSKIAKVTTAGAVTEYALPAASAPRAITTGPDKNLWFTDYKTSKVGKITTTGAVTEYALPAGSNPTGIAAGPDGNLWVTDNGTSKLSKITTTGTITEYTLAAGSSPQEIAAGAEKNLWFTNSGSNKVAKITTTGTITEYVLPAGSNPLAITSGPDENLWLTNQSTSEIGKLNPKAGAPTEGEQRSPNPGATLEYHLPISGTGLPTLTSAEVEKWGQSDLPTEGMAIFPPDEPQGWPASSYKRASITYLDELDRPVNTVSPTGAISTSEYNETNAPVRKLSPDNRATAVKESCESKTKCKSAELAKLLDTENTYNTTGSEPGTELLSTLGPQHTIKLANGTQVEGRAHTVYSYNEGAPAEGGPYHLVTKKTESALVSGKDEDSRTTAFGYSGQENIGWRLRKATSVTTDPGGLSLTHSMFFDPSTGNTIETRQPAAGSGNAPIGGYTYAAQMTKIAEGCTPVAMAAPFASAFTWTELKGTENLWVADTAADRIDELSPTGKYVGQFGTEGAGNAQFKEPRGVAVDKAGNVWVADSGNNRVEEISATGAFIRAFGGEGTGNGQMKKPVGLAITAEGNVWVADTGNSRLQEFSATGTYMRKFAVGAEPQGLAVDTKGDVWTTASNYVWEFSPTGEALLAFFGGSGSGNGQFKEAAGLVVSGESVYVVDHGNNRVQQFKITEKEGKTAGEYVLQFGTSGSENGQLKEPQSITIDSEKRLWVTDTGNNRVEKFNATGTYLTQYTRVTESCTPPNLVKPDATALDSSGNTWVADTGASRVVELTATGEYLKTVGFEGTGNGQFKEPRGIAIDKENHVWIADTGNNRLEELSSTGAFIRAVGYEGTGNAQFKKPTGLATTSEGAVWVADTGNSRIQEISASGTYLRKTEGLEKPEDITLDAKGHVWITAGSYAREYSSTAETLLGSVGGPGSEEGQFKEPAGLAISGENLYVIDRGNNRVQKFRVTEKEGKLSSEYLTMFGLAGSGNGQLKSPEGIAIDKEAHVLVADAANNRLEQFKQVLPGAHASQTIYYTAAANSAYPSCGAHPEWANLPCQTQPAKQPETSGLPNLPVTTVAYNMWDEPETTSETVGTATRTKTAKYDAAGRPTESTTSSSVGTALPTVTEEYNSQTGALEKQSTSTEGKTATITSVLNTIGQLTSYTDADGNIATYEYEPANDARLTKANDGKGTQTYTYDPTTGFLAKVADSAAGTFTGNYDIEGNLATQGYPNGMNENYTRDSTGRTTGLEYLKTTHCTEKCTWYSDSVVPSIHGQWISRTSTLSSQNYTYDAAGRLTQVQNTPAGKGCTTRIYAYDEDSNRLSLTTREPGTKGECTTTGGTVESHGYDSADRLTDSGTGYNTFGDITALPATDAGGSPLTSAYYVDNQLQSETQSEQTIGYNLDPVGRTRETVSTGKKVSDIVSHYVGPESAPAWTAGTSGEWTRNISGIGGFEAVQSNSEAPVLQLTNLHGDVVATAYLSETATALASTADTSEFGVPTTSVPPKYSWLGADEIPTELPSGVSNLGARSYVPQLGRFLQPDPIPGGSANAYGYTFGDPVNASDPSGESSVLELIAGHASEVGAAALAKEEAEIAARRAAEAAQHAAEEASARREAESNALLASWNATWAAGPQYANEEEWYEEEWEEEGGEEDASYNHSGSGKEEAHIEDAVLYQPLREPTTFDIPIWNEGHEAGSRCVQYGGHWKGKRCVGVKIRGGGPGNTCRAVAGATAPLAFTSGGGAVLWIIGFGTCWLP